MVETLFSICNTAILGCWFCLIVLPRKAITQQLIRYPYVPLVLSVFYLYFLSESPPLSEADFSSLSGILALFLQATPASAAAGWVHYLGFDFWMGAWMVQDQQQRGQHPLWVLPALLCTFMLGPTGVLIYTLILGVQKLTATTDANG